MADIETIQQLIIARFGEAVKPLELNPPQAAVMVAADQIVPLFEYITSEPELNLNYISAISGVDLGVEANEIEIVYFVSSIQHKHKLMVKARVARLGGKIDTISAILKGANWFEREIWELFGVDFVGHPKLKQLLLPDDWNAGNPMLRDWDGPNFERMPEA
ncbi:MAG: NADH-quinone oxidoreductase subunit C [bacterium]